jgi:hypothetical protein
VTRLWIIERLVDNQEERVIWLHDAAPNFRKEMNNNKKCTWIGENNTKCCNTTLDKKEYCKRHYDRMYIVLLPEMADYILEKELNEVK